MRIAMLCLARGKSGTERVAFGLAKALTEAGESVVFLGRDGVWLGEQCARHGIPYVAVPQGRWSEPFTVWWTLIRHRVQALHCHLSRAVCIGVLMRLLTWKRVIATSHITAGGYEYRAVEVLGGTVIAVSRHCADHLRAKGLGRRLVVIHNPIAIPIIKPGTAVHVPDRVLCLGRIARGKGVHLAIEAVASLPGISLEIVGPAYDTVYLEELHALATRLGAEGRIEFHNEVEDVAPVIDRCGCLLACSEAEAFGLTLIEALARGKPVVAVDHGAHSELLKGFEGAILCPRDAASLAEGIQCVLKGSKIQAAANALGPAMAARFDRRGWAKQHLSILKPGAQSAAAGRGAITP